MLVLVIESRAVTRSEGDNAPGPRVERAVLSTRVDVGGEGDTGGEAAVLAVLLPPGVVAAVDGAHIVGGGLLAVMGLSADGVVLVGGELVSEGLMAASQVIFGLDLRQSWSCESPACSTKLGSCS